MSLSNSLKYASSILLIFIIIDHYGKHILQLLLSINISYIFIVILISTIQYILSAYRWMYISKYTNLNIDFYDSIKFYYISSFSGMGGSGSSSIGVILEFSLFTSSSFGCLCIGRP